MAAYPSRPYAWTVVAILIATAVLSYTDRQVLSLLVDPIRGDTAVSAIRRSACSWARPSPSSMESPASRWGFWPIAFRGAISSSPAYAVWSLGTIACGFSHNFGEIFASRIVVGLGEAALSPAAISLISDYFPPSRRGTAVGSFLSGIAMGNGAAILIGGGVLHAIGSGALAATPLAAYAPWRMVSAPYRGAGALVGAGNSAHSRAGSAHNGRRVDLG